MFARTMNNLLAYLLLVLGLGGCLGGCSAHHSTSSEQNSNEAARVHASSSVSSVGFGSREKLLEHYKKHGGEFGNISIDEYLRIAQTLRDRPAGATIIEAVRADNVVTRFDRDTSTFIAFNRDATIRTCFKPNDGEAYFRRQLKRRD